jgi:hypothetical protein
MIVNFSSGYGLLSRIQAQMAPWYRQTVVRSAAGRMQSVSVERGPRAAIRLAFRTHWIVVMFVVGMGLLLRFGN